MAPGKRRLPLQPPPLQPVNVDPAAATAERRTTVPLAKPALQVAPQSMPAGMLVTVPPPVPALTMVRTGLPGGGGVVELNVAVMAVAAVIGTTHAAGHLHAL